MISHVFTTGRKSLLPFFLLDVAEKSVIVCINGIFVIELFEQCEIIVIFLKHTHFHSGGTDINTKYFHIYFLRTPSSQNPKRIITKARKIENTKKRARQIFS